MHQSNALSGYTYTCTCSLPWLLIHTCVYFLYITCSVDWFCVYIYPNSSRHRERPLVDVFDMARLRLQAPVRRPSSRNLEPRNLLRIHDSLQLKYTGIKPIPQSLTGLLADQHLQIQTVCLYICVSDAESRLGFREAPKVEEADVSSRRRWDYREPYHQSSSQRSTVQDGQSLLKI